MAMSPHRRGLLAAGGVILVPVLILLAINWQVVVLIFALVASNFVYQPPITKHVEDWGKPEFTAHLSRTFPKGTAETVVVETLRKQRFTVDPKARTAVFKFRALPCNTDYDIRWTVDASGRLTAIEGDHIMVACL